MFFIKSPEVFGFFLLHCVDKNSQREVAMCMELLCVCVCSLRSVMKEGHGFSAHYDTWIWATKTDSCTCVSQAILLRCIVLKTQDWKVPLGQKADWVITREQAGEVIGLKKWCWETVRKLSVGKVENLVKGFLFWVSHIPIVSTIAFTSLSNVCLTVIQPIGLDLVLSTFVSLSLSLSLCRSCLLLKHYDSLAVIAVNCLLEVCVSPECNHRMVHHFYYM